MLKGNLYRFVTTLPEHGKILATINFNHDDEIFKGHYPGQPILPGACILQLVKDILEEQLNYKIILAEAVQMKFLAVITPTTGLNIQSDIAYSNSEDRLDAKASLYSATGTHFKFQGIFKPV